VINSKLLNILRSLSPSEFNRLGLFLRSPYFIKNGLSSDELQMFEILESQYPNYTKASLSKSAVFAMLYPESEYVKGKLEKKMTSLFKQIERFLIQEMRTSEEDDFVKKLSLTKFYREKKIDQLYRNTLKQLQKIQSKILRKSKGDFYNDFLLQKEISDFKSLRNTHSKDLNLPKTIQSLDTFYITTKLEYSCGLLSQNNFHIPIDVKDSFAILEKITSVLKGEHFSNISLIKIYLLIFTILQNMNDPLAYEQLEKELEKNESQIPLEQLQAIQGFCRSFCIRQVNHGNKSYIEKTFFLYKKHLEEGLLLQKDGILAGNFRNIVSVGLRQKQFGWVKEFLDKYKNRIIGTESPEEVYHYNLSHYYYELADYENALKYLVDNFQSLFFQIAARRLEIKVYYEQESVLLESKIDTFKIFIHRLGESKLPAGHWKGNNNFINGLKQIKVSKTRFDKKRIGRLIEKIEKQEIIFEKQWLLEKLLEIKI